MEAQLREKTDEARNMESGMCAAQLEFDRRLTSQKHAHEAELSVLIKKLHERSMERRVSSQPESCDSKRPSTSSGRTKLSMAEEQQLMHRFTQDEKHISTLVKHIKYYKSKTTLLQQQVDQLVKSDKTTGSSVDRARHRIQQLEHANDKLLKELVNIKAFLKSSSKIPDRMPSTVVVQKSRLREVSKPTVSNQEGM